MEVISTNIIQANARGPNNGVEYWFDLIHDELINRGHSVRQIWLRGTQPTNEDVKWADFAIYHFSQVANRYKRLGVPFCIMPSANDCFVDNGKTLKIASSHNKCKFVTYQSQFHLKKYIEWGIQKPSYYVPHPVRIEQFRRTKAYNPNGKIVAGGRLIPKKGLYKLKSVDNLTVFGDGPLRDELKNTLHKNTIFTGNLNGDELQELFNDSKVYLFPAIITSDGDSEGISNSIKEALLMELPVICTPIAGNKEFENVIHLKDWLTINDLLKETSIYIKNTKGRNEVIKKYSPNICVDKLEKAIERYI